MEEDRDQKELFEFGQARKSFSKLTNILPKADFEGKVIFTITLEKLVFISIGIIMAMVVVYALGVESGRSDIKSAGAQRARPANLPPLSQSQIRSAGTMPSKSILNTAPIVTASAPLSSAQKAVRNQPKTIIDDRTSKPYTIIAGAFAKNDNAKAAGALLARQGLSVKIQYVAPYYRVSVGAYADKNGVDAERDLAKVKRLYKDAALRLR